MESLACYNGWYTTFQVTGTDLSLGLTDQDHSLLVHVEASFAAGRVVGNTYLAGSSGQLSEKLS